MDDSTPTVDAPSKPPQRFRRTRVAVSVFFGVLTVALMVLWVRSYWRADLAFMPASQARGISLTSVDGQLIFALNKLNPAVPNQLASWDSIYSQSGLAQSEYMDTKLGFVGDEMDYWTVWGPHWFAALFTAGLAAASWLPAQFSLRTLLIGATLVAVVLGLGVWLAS